MGGPLGRPIESVADLLCWIADAEHLRGNPLRMLLQRRPTQHVTRFLPAMCQYVRNHVVASKAARPSNATKHARGLATNFYLMGRHISEVSTGLMKNPGREIGAGGTLRWRVRVIGKDLKYRCIPVSAELSTELVLNRQTEDLAPMPASGVSTPQQLSYRQRAGNAAGNGVKRTIAHNAIKAVFEKTAA